MSHYFDELVALLATLRTKCPWDKEQTHQSLLPYLLEESYELLGAIDSGDPQSAKDELGDVLLQVVFHAQLYNESGDFDAKDVVRHLIDKLTYRHRSVLTNPVETLSADDVQKAWDKAKQADKDPSFFKDKAGSALMKADSVGRQAAAVGFDFADWSAAFTKVQEEMGELSEAVTQGASREALAEELGDCFFALTNLARQLQLDSELVALQAVHKFQKRFDYVQTNAPDGVEHTDSDTLEKLWQQAKS